MKVARACIDPAELKRRIQAAESAASAGGLGPEDTGTITGNRDGFDRRLSPWVDHRVPAGLALVPSVRATGRDRQLGVRNDTVVQQQMVDVDRLRRATCAPIGHARHALSPFGREHRDTSNDRNVCTHVTDELDRRREIF
jgi:hypothetical protein